MVRWCCRKPKGRKTTKAAPAPSLLNPPPDHGGFPAAVVALGLQEVWALRTTAGPVRSPAKRLGVDALPPGVTFSDAGVYVSAGAEKLDGWIIDRPIYAQFGTGWSWSLSNSVLSMEHAEDIYNIRNGADGGGNAITANISRCKIICRGGGMNRGGIVSYPGSTLNISGSLLLDAALDQIVTNGGSIESNFINRHGQVTEAGAHLEQVYLQGGAHTIRRNLFDVTGTAIPDSAGSIAISGGASEMFLTLEENVMIGHPTTPRCFYTMQGGTGVHDFHAAITRNVMQAGVSGPERGYFGHSGAGHTVATDNLDFDTAANIDANILAG